MACEANVTKGKMLVLLARNDGDTAWEVIGGVKSLSYTADNPVEDVTSSSTVVDYLESEWTGYSQFSANASGYADKRTGIVDPATGLNIVGSVRLLEIATTGNRCGQFRIMNTETNGTITGFLNVTSYNRTSERPGLVGFDATFQSKSDVVFVGEV